MSTILYEFDSVYDDGSVLICILGFLKLYVEEDLFLSDHQTGELNFGIIGEKDLLLYDFDIFNFVNNI